MNLEEIEFKVIRGGRQAARYDFGPEINVQIACMLQRMADIQNKEERLDIMRRTMDDLQQTWLSDESIRTLQKRSWLQRQMPAVKVRPLNDYVVSHNDGKSSFKESMLKLLGTNREILSVSPNLDRIQMMTINSEKYGALMRSLYVIVRHTKPRFFLRVPDEHSPGGLRPSNDRIEYFHRLHLLYGIDETDGKAVSNFDHYLCQIIRKVTI